MLHDVVVASRDWGEGNDPEALELAFHQGPKIINAYCQAATNQVDWLRMIKVNPFMF